MKKLPPGTIPAFVVLAGLIFMLFVVGAALVTTLATP